MTSCKKRTVLFDIISVSLYQIRSYAKKVSYKIDLSPKTREKCSFLIQVAGMSKKKAELTLNMVKEFNDVSLDSMKQSFIILRNAGYQDSIPRYPDLLCISNSVIRSRITFLKDCNFTEKKIPWLISDFKSLPSKRISILKNFGLLPADLNLVEHFCSLCHLPLDNYSLNIDDWTSLKDIYLKFYKLYLSHELDVNEEMAANLWKRRWTSLRSIRFNIKLMRDVFSFSNYDLINKSYLLHIDPDNVVYLLKSYKEINIKEIIKKNPKILTVPKEIIARNVLILREYNIPLDDSDTIQSLLCIKKEVDFHRLIKVLELSPLNSYTHHPRLPYLVKNARIAEERLNALKKIDMKCFTLNQLASTAQETFAKHLIVGIDKVRPNDIINVVSKITHYSSSEVQKKLNLNPYLGYVPLYRVTDTIDYLTKLQFSSEEIFHSLQIVLYHKSVVEDALMNLVPSQLKAMKNYGVPQKTILALALYCIEKEFNFSGNGIWRGMEEMGSLDLFEE